MHLNYGHVLSMLEPYPKGLVHFGLLSIAGAQWMQSVLFGYLVLGVLSFLEYIMAFNNNIIVVDNMIALSRYNSRVEIAIKQILNCKVNWIR